MSLGENIRALRATIGITQQELADVIGVTDSHVSGIECGTRNPSKDTLRKLSDALGVNEEDLLESTIVHVKPYISINFEYLRTKYCLKKSDIADLIGMRVSDVSKIERGNAHVPEKAISIIADYFGISEHTLKNKKLKGD